MSFIKFFVSLLVVLFLCGCQLFDEELVLLPSDITLTELEKRMAKAMDPDGRYEASRGCVIRQTIKVPQFLDEPIETLVETKLKRPGKFRTATFKDNAPVHVIGSVGHSGWRADYSAKRITMMDGKQLKQMLVLAKLGNQPGGYSDIFKKVEIFRALTDEAKFYILKCTGEFGGQFDIYVDAETYYVSKVETNVKINAVSSIRSTSKIASYRRYDGVLVPQETEVVQNGQKQTVTILDYDLDQDIPDSDFQTPVF